MLYYNQDKGIKGEKKMTVREWLEQHPEAIVEEIGEGYGDGWMSVEDVLDEEIRNVWYDEETKIAEIYI